MVMGMPDVSMAAALLPFPKVDSDCHEVISFPAQPTAEQRVERFRASVLLDGQRLAVYFSVVNPLTPPVMRLIQAAMLPETGAVALAQVILGGLLRPDDQSKTSEETVKYDFWPGVRNLLQTGLTRSEFVRVNKVLHDYLEEKAGSSFSFLALLRDESGTEQLPPDALPFVQYAREVAKRFGLPGVPVRATLNPTVAANTGLATLTEVPSPAAASGPTAAARSDVSEGRSLLRPDDRRLTSSKRDSAERSPTAPDLPGRLPESDGSLAGLPDLRQALLDGQPIPELSASALQQILRHSPRTLDDYRLAQIAEWSQARYALDKRFTRLTLLLDQGPDAQGTRWQAQQKTFDDLRDVLGEASEAALVLLGPPGCGKSTLLRRLELDLAVDALRMPADDASPLSFLVPLNRYRPARPGEAPPLPRDWLAQEWSRRYPQLPAFGELLASGRLVLLLDAVNEIPHTDEADYRERIALWRDFLAELAHRAAGTRALFSCRSLDYSASLSTPELPVPHVRIEAMSDTQVEQFLALYSAERGPALWRQLRGTPLLDYFRSSPFFLRLLPVLEDSGGLVLNSLAALLTAIVRHSLEREIVAGNPLLRPGALLDRRDHQRVLEHAWRDANDLPERGPLLPALARLAHALQARGAPGQSSRVRAPYDEALALLGGTYAKDLLHAGVALRVIEVQFDDVFFVHQLLQEYFAARAIASQAPPQLVATAWRAAEISPSLTEVLVGLADADPLPEAPTTGWEETFVLAAALAPAPESFVGALIAVNLPLAGRCAAQPDVAVSPALRERLQQALVERSRDPAADLRARIAAARALGKLGDPRFERCGGPHGDYLRPPLVAIEAATYRIGSDEGLYADEAPAHDVLLKAFAIGRFPVTNAEWRLFIDADGYQNERWWHSQAARRWQRGEGIADGPKQQARDMRQTVRDNPAQIDDWLEAGRITSAQARDFAQWYVEMSDGDFEALLDNSFSSGVQTQPRWWHDPAYNHPAQPVVGVCWHEARAYCAWLSAQTGQDYRLPSEVEWEAAARGQAGRRYAWEGDFDPSRCNSFEGHVRGTTPIGVFPAGDTPQGLADVSGNVWEWTSSAYEPYPYAADSGREDPDRADARRVVRGGSWAIGHGFARCAHRYMRDPGIGSNDSGFRLALLSHDVSPFRNSTVAHGAGDSLGHRTIKVVDGDNSSSNIVSGTQIVNHYYKAAGGSAPSREEIARQVAGYLLWLQKRTQSIELRGIERVGGAAVVVLPIESAYVPLRARSLPRPGETQERLAAPGKATHRRPAGFDEIGADRAGEASGSDADVALNEVLGLGNRLAIIGGPGCGKTTVLLHMAWALASSLLAGQPEPARSRLGLTMAPSELPLPILVPLASFARYRRQLPAEAPANEKTLAHFISHHLISSEAPFDLPADFFVRLLKDGRNVLLLLDGLDEVANEGERAEVRQSVQNLVAGRSAMRVVVTCRTIACRSGGTALGADFREIAVQALDYEQHIAPMVRQAYACIHPQDPVRRNERADDLLAGILRLESERRQRIGENAEALVDSPLMVRLLLIVHLNNRALPEQRADLFDKAINALLQVDYGYDESDKRELSADWTLYRDMAQQLAFRMHQQGADQGREIEEPALRAILRAEPEFQPRLDDFLRHARQRGSVLEERDGAYRFLHLALQEFLVARYLSEVIGRDSREAMLSFLAERIEDPWWREPILLLAGYQATHAARSARELLRALAEAGGEANAQFSAAELAATAALEWRESGETLRADCAQRIVRLLSDDHALANSQPVVRARAGDRLAQLGDPRFDRERFHLPADEMLGFVRIAADPGFMIGTRRQDAARVSKIIGGKAYEDEINDAPTPTSEFYIARYPVTVGQFRAFVEATGCAIGDADALADPDSRPARRVNWHEAHAWCDWLNEMLATSPACIGSPIARLVREQGWRVALPSELEWEKAARGGLGGSAFPWPGDADPNRANYAESQIGDTSAVGCFVANGFGLFDMVGNVWEWTRSIYLPYPYDPTDPKREELKADEEARRVVRGGSWSLRRDLARCASRSGHRPGLRHVSVGFRVVLRGQCSVSESR